MSFKSFFVKKNYVVESVSGDMLDISIPKADKYFNLNTNYTIEEKTDGVKLTLFRNDKPYSKNLADNWIVAYKNNILHPSEFKSVTSKKAKEQGFGISQYRLVFDHLIKVHKNAKEIPTNTEFFVEFLMRKPTLTRDYENKHGMILIGYSHNVKVDKKSDFRLYTKDTKLNQDLNSHYADILELDLPKTVFDGNFSSFAEMKKGAQSDAFKSIIRKNKAELDELYLNDKQDELKKFIENMLLNIPSVYGGKTEGVVLKDKESGRMYKFLQSDQHDKDVRAAVKQKYSMDKEKENEYFTEIKNIAKQILKVIDTSKSHSEVLAEISEAVHKRKLPKGMHTKKSDHQIKEDLHLTIKMQYEKMLHGWAAIVGKFRIVTKEHVNMIEYALDKYKGASVMIVTGSREKKLAEANKEILEEIFKGKPVEFFIASTGNIIALERKTRNPIVAYVCGPDRKTDYQNQLTNANNDSIVDVYDGGKREEVSASNAELFLKRDDLQQVKKIVHPVAYKHIDKWKRFYD